MSVKEIGGIWHVSLSPNHPQYQSVGLVPRFNDADHRVVVVDARKFIHFWSLDYRGYFLPEVDQWEPSKREGIFHFLSPPRQREKHVEMPVAFLNETMIQCREKRFLVFKRTIERTVRYVGFTNGRHRTRYLAHAGAIQLPIETSAKTAQLLESYCGVTR